MDQLPRGLDFGPEAVDVSEHEPDARAVDSVQDGGRILERRRERFLHQDMRARLGGVLRAPAVHRVGETDDDRVDTGAQHVAVVDARTRTKAGRDACPAVGVDLGERRHQAPRKFEKASA